MADFFDAASWGPLINALDARTRQWLNANPHAWPVLVEASKELLKAEVPVSMKLVVELARHHARKSGISLRLSNGYTTYIRNLICMEMPEARKYLTGGRRSADVEDRLEL